MSSRDDATVPATRRSRKSTSGSSPTRKAMEKENATIDIGSSLAASRKKSRSKSIGPGGLDILKPGNGNRRVVSSATLRISYGGPAFPSSPRYASLPTHAHAFSRPTQSLAAPSRPPPRSILKPTIPFLPEIPPHKPKYGAGTSSSNGSKKAGSQAAPDSWSGTKVALRTEEEQQAAAREREERERAELEKEINDRREARRKSLANRRVSFAAEATLHTFHEIEYLQDSTTSTDSTRRASSLAARSPAQTSQAQPLSSDASEPPSTPPERVDDMVPDLSAEQRQLHQKKRRRSSGMSPVDYQSSREDTLASTVYSSDSEQGDGVIEDHAEEASDSGSDSDADDGTMMTLDADDVTTASGVSAVSGMSSDTTSSLDEMLRIATQRAGAQSGEPMVDEEEELIPAFVGWGKKPAATTNATNNNDQAEDTLQSIESSPVKSVDGDGSDGGDMDMDADMDMTRAVGGIIKGDDNSPLHDEDSEIPMDMTRPLGRIVGRKDTSESTVNMLHDQGDPTCFDQTMDFTVAMGGIQSQASPNDDESDDDTNEDMSMEMTTVMGGVLASLTGTKNTGLQGRRRTIISGGEGESETIAMEMTVGLGKIWSGENGKTAAAGETEEDGEVDATMGMDMTNALGGIMRPNTSSAGDSTKESVGMDALKAVEVQPKSLSRRASPIRAVSSPPKQPNRSPGRSAFKGKEIQRTPERKASPARMSPPKQPTRPASAAGWKQSPDRNQQPKTPPQTTPSNFIGCRSKSPKRQASPANERTPVPSAKPNVNSPSMGIFQQDPATGIATPRVVLTPQRRKLSGIGADKPGLGSPKVAQLFGRRGSIGDAARDFIPGQSRKVAWEDPRVMEQEIDRHRQDELAKEDGRRIVEREADGFGGDREPTLTDLKEMIQGLSPKKNPLKGRKSLHIGSAKGLLGKRPAELDEPEDSDEKFDGVKRLKGHQGSPVKNIKLQQPPSKAETTGRLTRSQHARSTATSTLAPSPKKTPSVADSPMGQKRFKGVEDYGLPAPMDLEYHPGPNEEELMEDDGGERISLQDFLNMTSIRFMELTTTKRRHTIAQSFDKDGSPGGDKSDMSFERCVVAGACTVPMLELYQHSCRELKKYISEGRDIVREIETETLEDNPPLFREYMSATPEFKLLMDNQFKNVKTHARLLSKAMWYEWRMKLQDGLKQGLCKTAEGMDDDDKLVTRQQELLDSVLPPLISRLESLESEHQALDEAARELADCDPEELRAAREELLAVNDDLEAKKKRIAELQQELQESEAGVTSLAERKQLCIEEIKEAERVREECRGWSSGEIMFIKARVEAVEKEHGWAVTGCAGTTISMTYLREVELVFDPTSAYFSSPPSSEQHGADVLTSCPPIDFWYIAANRERNPVALTPERDFFLQCIRDRVRSLTHNQPYGGELPHRGPVDSLSRMLGIVRAGWDRATVVADHVRILNLTFPSDVRKTSDNSIEVRSTVFLAPLKTKLDVVIGLQCQDGGDGDNDIRVAISPRAKVVYGQPLNTDKMGEFLASRIGGYVYGKGEVAADQGKGRNGESWGDVVVELHSKLLSEASR